MKQKTFLCLFLLSSLIMAPIALQAQQEAQKQTTSAKPERQIKLEGQVNFRDLGGYRTTDGRIVKNGLIYRAGQLNKLTDADISKLKELGIRTVIDFRATAEAETRGKDRLPEGVRNISLPIDINSLPKDEEGTSAGPADFMLQATRSIMIHRTDIYAALIQELAEPENRPLVFHCTAGKDRAGVGAAIVLTLLGVPWKTVREDYLLSNFYRREGNERDFARIREYEAKKQGISPDQVSMKPYEGLLLVKPEYIDAAHDEVIRKYGSMESYLQKGLGISKEMILKLQKELLE
jgi:protein-tyrosine phosphatase